MATFQTNEVAKVVSCAASMISVLRATLCVGSGVGAAVSSGAVGGGACAPASSPARAVSG